MKYTLLVMAAMVGIGYALNYGYELGYETGVSDAIVAGVVRIECNFKRKCDK